MSLGRRLKEVLEAFDLSREMRAVTSQWPQVNPESVERAERHLLMQLDNLQTYATSMSDSSSTGELYEALAFWFMEARCEWAQVNLASNHQLWTSGVADQSLLIRGTVGSSLLMQVSGLLHPADIEALETGLMTTLNRLTFPYSSSES